MNTKLNKLFELQNAEFQGLVLSTFQEICSMSDLLNGIRKQFVYYKALGEKTFDQLKDEQLFIQPAKESNSIAIIVQHLWGNMMSRWTDFLNSDGEKEWRKRDEEFEAIIQTREAMMAKWKEAWDCLFTALNTLKEEDLERIVYIRNEGHTVSEAIIRQLAHYPYHIGQIVYIGKLFVDENWKSLSIPKNASASYNAEKFSKEKGKRHFTDEA